MPSDQPVRTPELPKGVSSTKIRQQSLARFNFPKATMRQIFAFCIIETDAIGATVFIGMRHEGKTIRDSRMIHLARVRVMPHRFQILRESGLIERPSASSDVEWHQHLDAVCHQFEVDPTLLDQLHPFILRANHGGRKRKSEESLPETEQCA